MKFNIYDTNKYVVLVDTDSMFVYLKPVFNKLYPDIDINDKEKSLPLLKEMIDKISYRINKFQDKLAKEVINSEEHYFDFKSELIVERMYIAGKRRYAQYIIDKEGIPVQELDIKGLDLMKSNFPPYFREFSKNIIKQIMFGEKKEKIDEEILTFRENIQNVEWKKLVKPTGLKNIDKYLDIPPQKGEIFSTLKSKCPINTRAAIIYNDLLRHNKEDKNYNLFSVGDKMYVVYLKDNPYKLDVLGINGYNDPPFINEMVETYIDKTKLFDSVLKNKLENLYNDIGWGTLILNRNINKFFKF